MTETLDNRPNQDAPAHILGRLMSGEAVVDRPNSHTHIEDELLTRALSGIDSLGRDFMVEQVSMGEQIGLTNCVETTEQDEIVYAHRPGRAGPTRFVTDREPEPSESVTVILKRTDEPETMVLISAWIGTKSEPEVWDRHATPASHDFWKSHALVWGSEPIREDKEVQRVISKFKN